MIKYKKVTFEKDPDILFYVPEGFEHDFETCELETYLNADVVINTKTNTLIKCRHSLEDVFDNFYKSLDEPTNFLEKKDGDWKGYHRNSEL